MDVKCIKDLSEQDIKAKFITPAIVETAGWKKLSQVLEEVGFTNGRIWVRGNKTKRGKPKIADYILYYKPNIPLAVMEVKDATHPVGAGMSQAVEYAEMMDIPFAFSSNGLGFIEYDRTGKDGSVIREFSMNAFPKPKQLWKRYKKFKGFTDKEEKIVTQDYYSRDLDKKPHYYQINAINRTIEAIAKKQNRVLLVMAGGTGKTSTAFQIIWRLWKAGVKKRILFLVDGNILVDQTLSNVFKPFADKMTKLKDRDVNKSYEIFLALYQQLTAPEVDQKIYKQFSPDFFDLIVVAECHRGSARADSEWREILDYFSAATQIGMTASPKESESVSNTNYFGPPVYLYSLRQGIMDGFLAPYKVIRVSTHWDTGWRPTKGKRDKFVEMGKRTVRVAERVTQFLKKHDRFAKSIIFCQDSEQAARMQHALINFNRDLVAENSNYIVRIISSDPAAKMEMDNFISPSAPFPVVAVTSQLMSTGVDAKTCKLIVIDRVISSLSEFKQITGWGTCVAEDCGKMFFTILDFRRTTHQFADPTFDGEPISLYDVQDDEELPDTNQSDNETPFPDNEPRGDYTDAIEPFGGADLMRSPGI